MVEDDRPDLPLLAVLHRIRLSPDERAVFARSDTAATLEQVRVLTAAAVYFNALAVDDFGGRLGPIRGRGLVEQVIGAAFQTYGGEDPHADLFERAAMLLRGITQGHPFGDGNKRTGFLLAALYLDLVDVSLPRHLSIEGVTMLSLGVSAGEIQNVRTIAETLRRLWKGEDVTGGRP